MKIALISDNLKTSVKLRSFLAERFVDVVPIILREHEVNDFLLREKDNFRAFVFDRLKLDLEPVLSAVSNKECYFIVNYFNEISFENREALSLAFRYYYHPLNYDLLADDIKSLSLVKKFVIAEKIQINNLYIDTNRRVIYDANDEVYLRNKEFELLLYLAKNKGKVLSRINILENVWDMNASVSTNTVDVHVSKIRQTLKSHFKVDFIKTVPCCGYILI